MTTNNKESLTHLKEDGTPRMVDVGDKAVQKRVAKASGEISLSDVAISLCLSNGGKKGSVMAVATIAAITASKKTSDLIPLCHLLPLDSVDVDFEINPDENKVICTATVSTSFRTGVEMEALTAVQIGLLTVYDMCKAVDKKMVISNVRLDKKTKSDI